VDAKIGRRAGEAQRAAEEVRRRKESFVNLYDIELTALDGSAASLADYKGKALLIVNVASQCGLTPQYAGLQALYETYAGRGLEVLGFPCNQFGSQEPGTSDEIKLFCESSFGVTFPLFAKIDVNGPDRHPLFEELAEVADAKGTRGDIRWNFEKFVVSPDGEIVARFSPLIAPDAPELIKTIEDVLPI
jgi:glutathione peroxidase